MKNKIKIWKILIYGILLMMYSSDFYGQNNILLKVKNVHKNKLSFPCSLISDCIDSIYIDKDTLFILLQDTRKFYKEGKATIILSQGYKINKRILEIPIEIVPNYNFVNLRTFDYVCVFKRLKNQNNKYEIFSIEEVESYDDKEFMKIKNSSDVNIRGE